MQYLIYSSIMVLALGVLTSPTLLALFHILMIAPAIYFLPKANYKAFPKSAWALLAMTIIIVLSVLVTQDIAVKGYKPISKAKYFLFGFVSLAPFAWYFKNYFNEKKISYLLYALCITSSLATLNGVLKVSLDYDIFFRAVGHEDRVGGFFGMLMNYAHNMSYFLIIVIGLVLYRDESKKYINMNFVYAVLIFNLIGFYMTYTRGAWLGLLVAVPFFFFKNNKKWFGMAFVMMVLLGVVTYFAAGKAVQRKDYDASRLGQWQASVAAFKERPFFGYGYLNFEEHSVEIKKRYNFLAPDFKGHAHNNFFEMLGSTGGIGFIAFILWVGFWFKELLDRSDIVAKIGLPFIVVFVVGGLTQSTISLGINLFFIIGVYSLTTITKAEIKPSEVVANN